MNIFAKHTLLSIALLLGGISLGLGVAGWSNPEGGTTMIQASINYADMVPQDLFGAWLRTRHIEKSNARDMENVTEEGAWVIFREGSKIVLKNPDTGAETDVTVDKVFDQTAVFHYNKQLSQGRWCHEQLTLTPENDGNSLQGFQIKECYKPSPNGGEPESFFQAFARVSGVRQNSLPPIR